MQLLSCSPKMACRLIAPVHPEEAFVQEVDCQQADNPAAALVVNHDADEETASAAPRLRHKRNSTEASVCRGRAATRWLEWVSHLHCRNGRCRKCWMRTDWLQAGTPEAVMPPLVPLLLHHLPVSRWCSFGLRPLQHLYELSFSS